MSCRELHMFINLQGYTASTMFLSNRYNPCGIMVNNISIANGVLFYPRIREDL